MPRAYRPPAAAPKRGGCAKAASVFAVAVIAVLAVVIATLVTFIARYFSEDLVEPMVPQGCLVTVEDISSTLTWEQSVNASIIVGESIRRGLPARAATIALVTAYQESDLRNLDYGDADSVGLFQQRPSQGWGTVEQIMDPWYSAGRFYEALVKVDGWETGVINDVAQAVQRSAHPEKYAQHESKGRAWASALTGHSPGAVSCIDRADNPADPGFLTDFIAIVWPETVSVTTSETGSLLVETDSDTTAWAIAQLALVRGQRAGLISAQAIDQSWTVSANQYTYWQPAAAAAAPVVLTLR